MRGVGLDRGRAANVSAIAFGVALTGGLCAGSYWAWRNGKIGSEQRSADLANAIGGGMIDVEPDVPSLVPFWLLVGVAVVAVLVALVLGVTLAVTSATES